MGDKYLTDAFKKNSKIVWVLWERYYWMWVLTTVSIKKAVIETRHVCYSEISSNET